VSCSSIVFSGLSSIHEVMTEEWVSGTIQEFSVGSPQFASEP
jgi:hypothetical protein